MVAIIPPRIISSSFKSTTIPIVLLLSNNHFKTQWFKNISSIFNTKNIISIKSADNYIEIYYLENVKVEKKLVRSTLKSNIKIESKKGAIIFIW